VEHYRDCQKNVPIEDRFSATTPYAAILYSEHYYGKRYKIQVLSHALHFFYCMFSVSGYHGLWFVHMHSYLSGMSPVKTGELAKEIVS